MNLYLALLDFIRKKRLRFWGFVVLFCLVWFDLVWIGLGFFLRKLCSLTDLR